MATNYGLGDGTNIDLNTADPAAVVCYINRATDEYNGQLGARVSSIFVILVLSTVVTFFPVIATSSTGLKVPLYLYLFAR